MNVALIGAGYWGDKYIKTLLEMPNVNLKWICKKNIKGFSLKEIKFTTNVDDVLNDPEVDCVIIATPANTHFKLAKKSIEAEKHILVEKPFTTNAKEAQLLIKLNKKNLILMPGHLYLHHPAIEKIKEIIDFDVTVAYTKRMNQYKYNNALREIAIHDIYILEYFFGKKIKVKNIIGNSKHNISNIKFNDTETYIEASTDYPGKIREIILKGENKRIIFNEMAQHKIIVTNFKPFLTYVENFDKSISPLEKQCRHFFDCIEGKDKLKITAEDGLRSVQTIEELYKRILK